MMLNPEEVASVIEHMNTDHADAVRSYATVHAGRPEVVAARLTGIERDALILECSGVEQRFELEVRLPEPIETLRDARRVLIKMARSAR
jgi:putative heme iron utilization protein